MRIATANTATERFWSQLQTGKVLGIDRRTVREICPGLGIEFKRDPHRIGLLLGRGDIQRIADVLGITPNWDACDK